MSDNLAYNYFYPHLKIGFDAELASRADGQRESIPIRLKFGNEQFPKFVEQEISVYDSGDILNFKTDIITKTVPENHIGNFEPNLIPNIEFAEPDFLWRYSPTMDKKEYWIPWLSLIILKEKDGEEVGEFEEGDKKNADSLPFIKLANTDALPDLNEAWRWAHIHLNEQAGFKVEDIKRIIRDHPHRAVSRLLAPRQMTGKTKYCAFVVPSFRRGMQAGLRQEVNADVNKLAWETGATNIEIPYYFKWEFRTGKNGSFDRMIKDLEARPIHGAGTRKMDVSAPGYGIPSPNELGIEGALRSPDTTFDVWGMDKAPKGPNEEKYGHDPDNISTAFPNATQKDLRDLLNSAVDISHKGTIQERRVVPPIYGQWYKVKKDDVYQFPEKDGDLKRTADWITELNLDFRHRAAAGLGVEFIKENQEALMQSAWKQLSEIKKINKELNNAKYGRTVSSCLYKRFRNLNEEKLLQFGLGVQDKVALPPEPSLNPPSNARSRSLKSRNASAPSMKTIHEQLKKEPAINAALSQVKMRKYQVRKYAGVNKKMRISALSKNMSRNVFKVKPDVTTKSKAKARSRNVNNPSDLEMVVKQMGETIKTQLDPKISIEKRMCLRIDSFRRKTERKSRIIRAKEKTKVNKRRSRSAAKPTVIPNTDPLKPLSWEPEFHAPMYRYLKAMSKDWILPKVANVRQNTISLLTTNERFIEAFMVGLNHEMAAELRWREYPSSLKATYFSKFWDSTIYSVDDNEHEQFWQSYIGLDFMEWVALDWWIHLGQNLASTKEREALKALTDGTRADANNTLVLKALPEFLGKFSSSSAFDIVEQLLTEFELGQKNITDLNKTIYKEYKNAINEIRNLLEKSLEVNITLNNGIGKTAAVIEAHQKAIQQLIQQYEVYIERWLLTRGEDKDIQPISEWEGRLGTNSKRGGNDKMVLLIRSQLLQKYPTTEVYLAKATKNDTTKPDFTDRELPIFEGKFEPDILFLGFGKSIKEVADYFLVFEEPLTEVRYGLEEGIGNSMETLAWGNFTIKTNGYPDFSDTSEVSKFSKIDNQFDVTEVQDWNNPAYIAKCFTEKSSRVAIPLSRFIF